MPYLIDGHNLIGALPDIELTDPHDEAKLVLKLRSWAARKRTRIVVVFDGGLPGGRSRTLSGGPIEAIFAAKGHTIADRVIISRLRRLPDPANWTVVSSDHEVLNFARRRGARCLTAQAFAEQLEPHLEAPTKPEGKLSPQEIADFLALFGLGKEEAERGVTLGEMVGYPTEGEEAKEKPSTEGEKPSAPDEAEVEAWLAVFGEAEAEVPPPPPREPPQRKVEIAASRELKEEGFLTPAEVDAWLELFGGEEAEEEAQRLSSEAARRKGTRPPRRRWMKHKAEIAPLPDATEDSPLDEEEIEMWRRLFGEEV